MAKKDKQRATAEDLFIEQGWTCKAISELLEVSEKTLSKWRTEDQWDDRRAENLAAPHKIRQIILRELKNIAEGQESKVNADAISKLSRTLELLSDRVSVQVVISVLKEFDNWMVDEDPSKASEFTEFHRRFIIHKINIDG